jgi:quercetin dioxygenase-like cupin family protein
VPKTWGHEEILVNNDRYCAKLLHIEAGAGSSIHRHPRKDETFYCLEGQVVLRVGQKTYHLLPGDRPVDIPSGTWHQFHGVTAGILLEVSTPHSDDDVERYTQSYRPGVYSYKNLPQMPD